MPSAFDQFMPPTRLQLPDGAAMLVGTLSCDDQIHQAVYFAYTPAGSTTPTMELELPPKSVELIIRELQEHANEARFINGERMLEYPKPYPAVPAGASQRKRKARRQKKKTSQRAAGPNAGPAVPPDDSAVAEGPPAVS
jgi:hypothetical protein